MLLLPVVRLIPALDPKAMLRGAGCVVRERLKPLGRVVVTDRVAKERLKPLAVLSCRLCCPRAHHSRWRCCRLAVVLFEARTNTDGRVGSAGCIANERINTVRRVLSPVVLLRAHFQTGGRVKAAGGVAFECIKTGGRVVARRLCCCGAP